MRLYQPKLFDTVTEAQIACVSSSAANNPLIWSQVILAIPYAVDEFHYAIEHLVSGALNWEIQRKHQGLRIVCERERDAGEDYKWGEWKECNR